MRRQRYKDPNLKRDSKKQINFNRRELSAIEQFCRQYKIKNKSKFMREAIITTVLKKFDDDYPRLFEDEHPTLFSRMQ